MTTQQQDRELLKLAAKAAGIELWPDDVFTNGLTQKVRENGVLCWNPIVSDGDALRLAVKLGIKVEFFHSSNTAFAGPLDMACAEEDVDGDSCAATRRAIVRAAAAIGRDAP